MSQGWDAGWSPPLAWCLGKTEPPLGLGMGLADLTPVTTVHGARSTDTLASISSHMCTGQRTHDLRLCASYLRRSRRSALVPSTNWPKSSSTDTASTSTLPPSRSERTVTNAEPLLGEEASRL